tara:strand:- start:3258 stop:3701 length:444 start_codon:yes stop_codon:yes gene_type:complete
MTKKEKAAAKARRARNKFRGINVTDAVLGYAGVSIWSEALLRVNPFQFFTDTQGAGNSFRITGRELLDGLMGGAGGVSANTAEKWGVAPANPLGVIMHNAKKNGTTAIFQSIGLGIAGSVGKKVTKKPRSFLNKTIKQFGMGEWIRF